MVKYYDPQIYGDCPIGAVEEYDGRLYVCISDYAALEARVDALESRLEIDPSHNVDGIDARNATIELQDAAIDELKARVAELKKDAARYRWLKENHNADLLAEDVIDEALEESK